jgi:hypothetical protein
LPVAFLSVFLWLPEVTGAPFPGAAELDLEPFFLLARRSEFFRNMSEES